MKKKYPLFLKLLILLLVLPLLGNSQINLYTQNFEGISDFDTYQLFNSGGSAVGFASTGTDYIVRAMPGTLPLGNSVSGFSGNVIAFEDHDGAGFFGQHYVDTDAIDISGATGLNFKFRLAAARGNDGNRYETGDFLAVQVSIDGGGFQTIINTGGTSLNNRYYYDSGMDGINLDGNDILVDQNSQEIQTAITGTGSSLVVRILFDSQGPQEEILFDDIIVDADMVLSTVDLSFENQLSLSPNPSNGSFTIRNSGVALDNLSIVDLNGRNVADYNLNGVATNVDLDFSSVLSPGLYLVQISSQELTTTKKLIIK